MRILKTGAILLIAAMMASGCSSSGRPRDEGVEGLGAGAPGGKPKVGGPEIGKYGAGSGGPYGAGGAYGAGGQYGGASPEDATGPLSKRIIYFMYDSSEVQPEYVQVINNHANYLSSHPGTNVVLEGHADERGSPEYNIALGEQRAKSVAKLMKLQGVSDGQIQIVSFGEEKPAVSGHDESAWQQNRRVEIVYPGR